MPKNAKGKGKSRKRGRGDNSGDRSVPDEVYERHLSKIESTAKAMDKAKEAYDQARGVHQNAFKAAKEDGCNTDAIRIARKLDKLDHGAVVIDYADVGRVLTLMRSPLGSGQLDLFGGISAPEKAATVDPAAQGLRAGRAAEPAENNPHPPGSAEFQAWAENWAAGQKENAEKFAVH